MSRDDDNAGRVVFLASGGPEMTLVNAEGDRARCVWMTPEGEFREAMVPVVALRHRQGTKERTMDTLAAFARDNGMSLKEAARDVLRRAQHPKWGEAPDASLYDEAMHAVCELASLGEDPGLLVIFEAAERLCEAR